MILTSALSGILAAFIVSLIRMPQDHSPLPSWSAPVFILIFAVVTCVVQKALRARKKEPGQFNGVADMLLQIHDPAAVDSSLRWSIRALFSAFLALFSGGAGPEGAAAEVTYVLGMKTRPKSARWFEQRRRTDAANAIASSVSAAFMAPFAAVLLPIEMGIGGTTLSSVMCALSAFLGMKFFATIFPVRKFEIGGALYDVTVAGANAWLTVIGIAAISGIFGVILIRFVRYSQRGLSRISGKHWPMKPFVGAVLLAAILWIYMPAGYVSADALQDIFWNRVAPTEAGILFFSKALVLALVLASFGTTGIFWPVFALGGFFGFAIAHAFGIPHMSAVAALVGATSFWGSALGAPLAGSVLVYEITDNTHVLLPCLIGGLIARQIARFLKTRSLPEEELDSRGMRLHKGRAEAILRTVKVRDAMVTDFETVKENESVVDLHERLMRSRYPFLPVIRDDGSYAGLLTVDMVQKRLDREARSGKLAARWLEVKDLLYRRNNHTPAVDADDRLSVTQSFFKHIPCVAVLEQSSGKVVGLLFVQNVRLAYEHAVARRSLHPEE